MGRRVIRVPRPEGGDERNVYWDRHHNCRDAAIFRAAMEDEDVDLVTFPIGQVGEGMPVGTPFAVQTIQPCGVCGVTVAAWFEWSAPGIVVL